LTAAFQYSVKTAGEEVGFLPEAFSSPFKAKYLLPSSFDGVFFRLGFSSL
jgi:hypothetical protein